LIVEMAASANTADDSDPECGTMPIEAEGAIKEIQFAVAFAELSSKLSRNDNLVYINLQTKEGELFCVELCIQGFRVRLCTVNRSHSIDSSDIINFQFHISILHLMGIEASAFNRFVAALLWYD